MKPAFLSLAACAVAVATPSCAQEVEWSRWGDPAWIVSRDATGCTERRADIGDTDTVVREDVSGAVTYRASGRDWRFTAGESYEVRLVQGQYPAADAIVSGRALGFRDARGWGGISVSIAPQQLTVFNSGPVYLFEGTGKPAITAFNISTSRHRCAVELSRVDHGSGEPVATRAKLAMTRPLITNDDYPAAALRAEQQGFTGFRLTISAKGYVSACEVTEPSGSAILDYTTCNILSVRAHFTPALDADGRPTEGSWSSRLRWEIPHDELSPSK